MLRPPRGDGCAKNWVGPGPAQSVGPSPRGAGPGSGYWVSPRPSPGPAQALCQPASLPACSAGRLAGWQAGRLASKALGLGFGQSPTPGPTNKAQRQEDKESLSKAALEKNFYFLADPFVDANFAPYFERL